MLTTDTCYKKLYQGKRLNFEFERTKSRLSEMSTSEMKNVPLANFLFKRVGSRYVERFKPKGTYRDARKLIKAGAEGESLAIFPEGTFTEKKGLDKFRTGAFLTAIKSNMPIVPLVIQGSREILGIENLIRKISSLLERMIAC